MLVHTATGIKNIDVAVSITLRSFVTNIYITQNRAVVSESLRVVMVLKKGSFEKVAQSSQPV